MNDRTLDQKTLDAIDAHDPSTFPDGSYPRPLVKQPSDDEIVGMLTDRIDVESTDGCVCDPDGICPHGHPSWLVVLGYI